MQLPKLLSFVKPYQIQPKSMNKILSFITLAVFFLAFPFKQNQAQNTITTGIGNFQICYYANVSMPVTVQNMVGVDSLRLVLAFNGNNVSFVDFFATHSALANGNFSVTDASDSIIISWVGKSPATIFNDTLVWVKFKGLGNSTNLTWQQAGSYYNKSGANNPADFINGSISVNPKIDVALTEINPTCTKTCVANYQADASGGTAPYTFLWNGKQSQYDFIQTNMCSGSNKITITDARGCKLDSTFSIKGLPGADVKLIVEGNEDTTIYLQNPVLSFRFEEVYPTHVVDPPLWEFGDGDTARAFNPTHVYSRANIDLAEKPYYILKLNIKNENGCDTVIELNIPIKEAKIKVPGVITPNSDGKNDVFMILNENKNGSGEEIKITTEYQRLELIVFDRWGRKLYDSNDYQSDWTAKGVPDGVYYYKLKAVGFYSTENRKGSLTILGSN
jgi:hypothetical protein